MAPPVPSRQTKSWLSTTSCCDGRGMLRVRTSGRVQDFPPLHGVRVRFQSQRTYFVTRNARRHTGGQQLRLATRTTPTDSNFPAQVTQPRLTFGTAVLYIGYLCARPRFIFSATARIPHSRPHDQQELYQGRVPRMRHVATKRQAQHPPTAPPTPPHVARLHSFLVFTWGKSTISCSLSCTLPRPAATAQPATLLLLQ